MNNDAAGQGPHERPVRPVAEAHKLSDQQIADMAFAVLRAYQDERLWRALAYNSGPYEVTKPTVALCHLARVFFGAGLSAATADCRETDRVWTNEVLRLIQRHAPHIPMSEHGDEARATFLEFARSVASLGRPNHSPA